jgi:hypothetical protein
MYRVIVLGGVALVAGCGARTGFREGGESSDAAPVDSSAIDTGDDDTGFPSELPVFEDTGIDDTGSFPSEADPAVDTGVVDTGFPHTTK